MKLGELLIEKGALTDEQLKIALQEQNVTGIMLGTTLINLGFVASREITQIVSEQTGIGFVDLDEYVIPEEALRIVTMDIAERCEFIPLNFDDGVLSIGVTNTTNIKAVDAVTQITGLPPEIFLVDSEGFHEALEKSYYFLENPIPKRIEGIVNNIKVAEEPQPTDVSSLTELVLMDGVRHHATDIHIRPMSQTVHVFYRIDGVMHLIHCLPKNVQMGIISRIKILSQLNIAETRLPQDGSFSFEFLRSKFDIRVSMTPTIFGENVVMRVLSSSSSILRLGNLGFEEEETAKLRMMFAKPYGIILITGPTGSGKTTTLYSALREIDLIGKNVMTVEDPVEYRLSMVRQTQVNLKAGYDFAAAGRSFMRQDPDVMLLGEIRDEETASFAVRASITGHMVLSTLHTNDAITSIPRLADLKVDRFLLSTSLRAVISQRLVRKICSYCKTEYEYEPGELTSIGFPELEGKVRDSWKGFGCGACNNTGYTGRMVIGEVFIVDDEQRELIYQGASLNSMREAAIKNGMCIIIEDGKRKAMQGRTTFEEVARVIG